MNLKKTLRSTEIDRKGNKRFPWIFTSTTYFAEGIPYILANFTLGVLLKNMGFSNADITLWTGWIYLAWVVKPLWGPLVDIHLTKRTWIVSTEFLLTVLYLLAAFSIATPYFLPVLLTVFWVTAFASATHDIAVDGFYMLAMSKEQQAFYVGIRSQFYRLAMWYGQGFLLIFTGWIVSRGGSVEQSWITGLCATSGIFLLLTLFHAWYLPFPKSDGGKAENTVSGGIAGFIDVFKTYFTQPKIIPIVAFILLYRLGEAFLVKIVPLFLIDDVSAGGLGLSNIDVGFIQGTLGLIGLAAGGVLGGIIIAKFGLRKCIWPMVLALNFPDVFYIILAAYRELPVMYVYAAVGIEQFGYGFGFTAFMVFLMQIAGEKYKTSHFAISTGLMALGMMVPGIFSGAVQEAFGYLNFFILVLVLTIPGMFTLLFIPIEDGNSGT